MLDIISDTSTSYCIFLLHFVILYSCNLKRALRGLIDIIDATWPCYDKLDFCIQYESSTYLNCVVFYELVISTWRILGSQTSILSLEFIQTM